VLLELTKPWHKKYAESHGMKYIDHTEKVETGKFSLNSEGMVWFASCLNVFPDGCFISVQDADTLIVQPGVALRDGLLKGYELAVLGGPTWVNGGVVFVLNTAVVRDFFRRIIERGPVGTTNWLDGTFREMLRETSVRWHYLDDRWNFFPTYGENGHRQFYYTEEEAIIRAWHGWDRIKALKQMSEILEKISGVKA
jgi:hypothetical protein